MKIRNYDRVSGLTSVTAILKSDVNVSACSIEVRVCKGLHGNARKVEVQDGNNM